VFSIEQEALPLPHSWQQFAFSIVALWQPSSFVLTLLSMAKLLLPVLSLRRPYLPGVSCP
jgi:hypothetical protein